MTDTTPSRDAREAHVQVLTAEVRTLVVGSRQVTMSVYNQLDEVQPGEIVPFGRVNPKDANWRSIYVVGRHVATGALVRSDVYRDPMSLPDGYRKVIEDRFAGVTQEELAEVAAQWSALTLIVLAGLR